MIPILTVCARAPAATTPIIAAPTAIAAQPRQTNPRIARSLPDFRAQPSTAFGEFAPHAAQRYQLIGSPAAQRNELLACRSWHCPRRRDLVVPAPMATQAEVRG